MRALGSTEVLALEPLSPGEIQTLVKHQLGVRALPAELTGFVDDRVAGHPFFCEQLVQTHARGRARPGAGRDRRGRRPRHPRRPGHHRGRRPQPHRPPHGGPAAVPEGRLPSSAARSCRARSPPPCRRREERAAVPEHLETLASLDLTMRESEHSELAYLFRHEITREVAYDLLTESQSRQLHRAVAEWHERTYQRGRAGPALRAAGASLGPCRRSRQGRDLPRRARAGRRCAAAPSTRR